MTAGRPKGSPNKITGDAKAMIHKALDLVGGVAYLRRQAEENPVAFMSLYGRTIPRETKLEITKKVFEIKLTGMLDDKLLDNAKRQSIPELQSKEVLTIDDDAGEK